MVLYLIHFKAFIKYVHAYEKETYPFDLETMLHAVHEQRQSVSKDLARSKKQVRKQMFARVPTHCLLRTRMQNVIDVLTRDLVEKKRTIPELKALNFFLLQLRLNCRSGVLLKLKWSEFDSVLKRGLTIETDDHKTGHVYDVYVRVQEDQVPFLTEMRARMTSLYGKEMQLIFANTKNRSETMMSTLICQTFQDLFGDDAQKVRFNANSIRKFWERRVKAMGLSSNLMNAHLAQTAHAQRTAEEHYIGVQQHERHQLMDMMSADLQKVVIEDPVVTDVNECEDSISSSDESSTPDEFPEELDRIEDWTERRPQRLCNIVEEPEEPTSSMPTEQRVFVPDRRSLNSTSDLRNETLLSTPQPTTTTSRKRQRASPSRDETPNKVTKTNIKQRFIKSMQNFTNTTNHTWTEAEKRACGVFLDCNNSITKKDVQARLAEVEISLNAQSCDFVYKKIKSAFQSASRFAKE